MINKKLPIQIQYNKYKWIEIVNIVRSALMAEGLAQSNTNALAMAQAIRLHYSPVKGDKDDVILAYARKVLKERSLSA